MSKAKVEARVYAVTISTEEAFTWITEKPEEFKAVCKDARVKAIHPDPQGRFFAFLYLHPKQRNQSCEVLRKYFRTAAVMPNPVYVDLSQ